MPLNLTFYWRIHTQKSEERGHLLPLDDNGWGHGLLGPEHLLPTRARLALRVLAVGSSGPETSPGLEGVRAAGFHPNSDRGRSLAPAACELHHAELTGSDGEFLRKWMTSYEVAENNVKFRAATRQSDPFLLRLQHTQRVKLVYASG